MQYARKRFLLFRRPLLYCVQPQLYLRRTGQPNLPPAAQWRKPVLQIRPRKPTRPRRNQKSRQQTHYFHCYQIGIPREITNKDGNLLWYGECTALGRLKKDGGSIRVHISPSACKTSMPTVRRGCITTSLGITSLMRVGLLIRIRLDCGVGQTFISFR